MSYLPILKAILLDTLPVGNQESLTEDTPLLGEIAELDSMAVVAILTAIEENFGIEIYDDEINADVFETFGTLSDFVKAKL